MRLLAAIGVVYLVSVAAWTIWLARTMKRLKPREETQNEYNALVEEFYLSAPDDREPWVPNRTIGQDQS